VIAVGEQIDCEQQKIDRRVYDEMDAKAAIVPDVVHSRTPERIGTRVRDVGKERPR
jgi:hypothetical protein